MEKATRSTAVKDPTGAKHPPILLAVEPGSDEALAKMDPAYRDEGKRDMAHFFPFHRKQGTFVCRHWKTGAELRVDDSRFRKEVSQAGAGQWMNLMNVMQALFIHQTGPKKGRQKAKVKIKTDSFEREFDSLDSVISFLSEMQEEWENWGHGG